MVAVGVWALAGGALTDFFSAAVAPAGFVATGAAVPVALEAVGGDGLTEPDPNVPELRICGRP